jgi:hypothetical protein
MVMMLMAMGQPVHADANLSQLELESQSKTAPLKPGISKPEVLGCLSGTRRVQQVFRGAKRPSEQSSPPVIKSISCSR